MVPFKDEGGDARLTQPEGDEQTYRTSADDDDGLALLAY